MRLHKAPLRSLVLLLPLVGLAGCSSDDEGGSTNNPGNTDDPPLDPGRSVEQTEQGEDNLETLTATGLEQAVEAFELAVKLDPTNDKAKFLLAVTSFVDFLNDVRTSQSGDGPATAAGVVLEKNGVAVHPDFPSQEAFSGPLPPTVLRALELVEGDAELVDALDTGVLQLEDLFVAPALLPDGSATGADYQQWLRDLRDASMKSARLLESIDVDFEETFSFLASTETVVTEDGSFDVISSPTFTYADALSLALWLRQIEIGAGFSIALDLDADVDELVNWEENGLPGPYRLFNGGSPLAIDPNRVVDQDIGLGSPVERRGFLNTTAAVAEVRSQRTFLPADDADATFVALRTAMVAVIEDLEALATLQVTALVDGALTDPTDPTSAPPSVLVDCFQDAYGPWLADVKEALRGGDPDVAPHTFFDATCGIDVALEGFRLPAAAALSAAAWQDRLFLPELDPGQVFPDETDFPAALASSDLAFLYEDVTGLPLTGADMLDLWRTIEGLWEDAFLPDGAFVDPGGGDPGGGDPGGGDPGGGDPGGGDPPAECGDQPLPSFIAFCPSAQSSVSWETDGSPNASSVDAEFPSFSVFEGEALVLATQTFGESGSDSLLFILQGLSAPGTYVVPPGDAVFSTVLDANFGNFTNEPSGSSFVVEVEVATASCVIGKFSGTLLSDFDLTPISISGSFDFRGCDEDPGTF